MARIDALLETHEFAVVQVELIQGVGGVRRVPENVIRHLDAGRKRWGYLLLVDEVQTGMYRTGPFIYSQTLELTPDLLLLGKATSDMMFPFALTLYSAAVRTCSKRHGLGFDRFDQETLRLRAGVQNGRQRPSARLSKRDVARQVAEAGELFTPTASGRPRLRVNFVRDVRVFGLLIGIELETRRWPRSWLRKRLSTFYLFSMLRHAAFPGIRGLLPV